MGDLSTFTQSGYPHQTAYLRISLSNSQSPDTTLCYQNILTHIRLTPMHSGYDVHFTSRIAVTVLWCLFKYAHLQISHKSEVVWCEQHHWGLYQVNVREKLTWNSEIFLSWVKIACWRPNELISSLPMPHESCVFVSRVPLQIWLSTLHSPYWNKWQGMHSWVSVIISKRIWSNIHTDMYIYRLLVISLWNIGHDQAWAGHCWLFFRRRMNKLCRFGNHRVKVLTF